MESLTLADLGTLSPTKTNASQLSKQIADAVKNGNADAIEVIIRAQFIADVMKNIREDIEQDVLSALKAKEIRFGATIEPAETGVKYDYSTNAQWAELTAKIDALTAERKEVEKTLQMATKLGKSIVDESTGEVLQPVSKTSKSSFKITLGK